MFLLKDLRNAIAHNEIIYDIRFKKYDASALMKKYLKREFCVPGLPQLSHIGFQRIDDYIFLVVYFLLK